MPHTTSPISIEQLFAEHPVLLAPMEDVTDAPYRALCRSLGAVVCLTEFVRAETVVRGDKTACRKMRLEKHDKPTGIQIYGGNADLLMEAATIAQQAEPTFIDINCGCWVPRVTVRGAGAAWLRDPEAMVTMAQRVVNAVNVPVTVKTRIGLGPESHMPIVDLARRLEDVGVSALTIHCRTAQMGHSGLADWIWAARAAEVVSIPVVVNGDVKTASDVVRALEQTGCAAVMIGRAAIDYPWVFREARALLDGRRMAPPSTSERIDVYRRMLDANIVARGEKFGVEMSRRHLGLLGTDLRDRWKKSLYAAATRDEVDGVLRAAVVAHDTSASAG